MAGPPHSFGRGTPLVQREEERERLEGADLAGKAPAVRLADGPIERLLRVANPGSHADRRSGRRGISAYGQRDYEPARETVVSCDT